jgi:hypothetical protein
MTLIYTDVNRNGRNEIDDIGTDRNAKSTTQRDGSAENAQDSETLIRVHPR